MRATNQRNVRAPGSRARRRHNRASFAAEPLERRTLLSQFYSVEPIAVTTEQTPTGDRIDSIDPLVSLNDNARAAYVANVSGPNGAGTAVIVDDANSGPVKISFPNPTAERAFAFPQINNAGRVVVRDRLSQGTPVSFVRTWDSASPGVFNIVASSADGLFDSVTLPTLSNTGEVAFVGFTGGSSSIGLYYNPTAQRGADLLVTDLTGSGGARPMLSDNGHTVVRKGTDTGPAELLLDGQPIAVVSTSEFAAIGNSPGISDDGQVVVFYGDLTATGAALFNAANGDAVPFPLTPGRGIFASVVLNGARHIVRVAGEATNGFIDPGERRPVPAVAGQAPLPNEVGPDFDYNGTADWQIGPNGFSTSSRVGVTSLRPFADPNRGAYVNVVYHANDVIGGTPGAAVYTSRLNLFKDASGDFYAAGVEAPVQVIRAGNPVPGFGAVQDVALYDPVNKDGQVAFWASGAAGAQAVVLATPRPVNLHNTTRPRFDPDSPLVEYVVADSPGNAARSPVVNQVVVHATGATESSSMNEFVSQQVKGIHYIINREGRVTQMIRESDVANHAPPTNPNSIGIELIDDTRYRTVNGKAVAIAGTGSSGDPNWATPVQLKKAALLVRDIALRHGLHDGTAGRVIEHLVAVNGPYVPFVFERPVPLTTGTAAQEDGINRQQAGVLAHGQVFARTAGRVDPQNFDWVAFMTRVNNGIGLTLNSPANLLITDPLGRRLGVDPATGQTVNEIPGATFTGAGTEPQSVAIPGAVDGQYQVKVVGTGNGPFHLDVVAAGRGGELTRTQVADVTTPGATSSYVLSYRAAGDAPPTVTAAANLPPVAFGDTYMTRGADPVPMPVLANDSDPEGRLDSTSVLVTTQPTHGTVTVDAASGMITYTPAAGFAGDDSFRYTVKDTAGRASDPAAVAVRVLRPTDPPVAQPDAAATPFERPVTINVLANDSDSDGTLDRASVEIDHGGDPEHGSLELDRATGAVTYTPDPGFSGEDRFAYRVLDNDRANSEYVTVIITVAGATAQEVHVIGNGVNIVSGASAAEAADGTDFGFAAQRQTGPTRVFTVSNIGVAPLTLGAVNVPAGFRLVETLVTTLAPGASDTFTVQLDTSASGIFGGDVSFATNDADENPFHFAVRGRVGVPPGSLDLSFGGGDGKVVTDTGQAAYSVVVQPDGYILAGGASSNSIVLVRYRPDGSLDPSFGTNGAVTTSFGVNTFAEGRRVLLRPDGKILMVGQVSTIAGIQVGVVRYNADGSLDTSFSGDGRASAFSNISFVQDAELQPDGKIVAIGSFNGHERDFAVGRLNPDGTPDATFGGGDGLAVIDLTPTGPSSNDPPQAVVLQPDGKIVVAGSDGTGSRFAMIRLTPDGSLDTTFGGGDGIVTHQTIGVPGAGALALQADGKIVVAGNSIARFRSDGSIDTSFGGGDGIVLVEFSGNDSATAVAVQPDGKIVFAGSIVSDGNPDFDFLLGRLNPDGGFDATFGGDGVAVTNFAGLNDFANAVVIQPDGKIVVAGSSFPNQSGLNVAVARYYGDPTVRPTVTIAASDSEGSEEGGDVLRFTVSRAGVPEGPLTVRFELRDDGGPGVAKLGDDFALSTGTSFLVTIPDGASSADVVVDVLLDEAFEEDELMTLAVLESPDYFVGLPLVADGVIRGEADQIAFRGEPDATFGRGGGFVATDFGVGSAFASSVAVAPDGKLLVAARIGGREQVGVARYRVNGTPDPSFDNDGLVLTPLQVLAGMRPVVAVQADGKVIAAGVFYSGSNVDFEMARYNVDGTVDTTFGGGDGIVATDFGRGTFPHDYVYAVLVQPDGKIVLAGKSYTDEGSDFALARYEPDGSLDATFGTGGLVTTNTGPQDAIYSVALSPGGKIVAVGTTWDNGPFFTGADMSVVRFNPDGSLDTTFGGTGVVVTVIADHNDAASVIVRPDGRIVVAGRAITDHPTGSNESAGVLAQYRADGSLDPSFGGGDGLVLERFSTRSPRDGDSLAVVLLLPDGRLLTLGADNSLATVARYQADGSPDSTFASGAGFLAPFPSVSLAEFADAALQPDGKLVYTLMGNTGGAGGNSGFNLTRLTGPLVGQSPRVTGVYVSGSGWTATFKNYLASTGQGDANLGYRVAANSQLLSLPWVNLDRISVRFDSSPDVKQTDLLVRGLRSAAYAFSDFRYDPATKTATWTLARPPLNDKLLLDLDAGPGGVSLNGVPMDGDWNNGADAYPSGDRTPGGDFRFRLNVLVGDLDRNGAVIADDFSAVKRKFFSTTAAPGAGPAAYSIFHDINGSGAILADDFSEVKKRFFNTLPPGEPAAPTAPASIAAPVAPPRAAAARRGSWVGLVLDTI